MPFKHCVGVLENSFEKLKFHRQHELKKKSCEKYKQCRNDSFCFIEINFHGNCKSLSKSWIRKRSLNLDGTFQGDPIGN